MSDLEEDTSLFKLKNYGVHPTQKNYWVFFFSDDEMAGSFEELLLSENILYDKEISDDLVKRTLFGIHKKYTRQAMKMNNIAIGKHRHPFIKDPILRFVIIFISVSLVALAIVGYLHQRT